MQETRIFIALAGALAASVAATWFVREQIAVGPASDGLPRQVLEERFPNGQIHVRREVIQPVDDEPLNDGALTVWYESGQLRSQGTWQRGQKHGLFEHWHENGNPAKRVVYDRGLADGPYVEWNERGEMVRSETWREGRRVESPPPQ